MEHISQNPCNALVRLDKPGPGAAAFGVVTFGSSVMATFSFYLYGDQAASIVARETAAVAGVDQRTLPDADQTEQERMTSSSHRGTNSRRALRWPRTSRRSL